VVHKDSMSNGAPAQEWATVVEPSAPVNAAPPPATGPELAVVVVDEDAPESGTALARATYEIWTRNRVYLLDSALTCLEITCRDTGLADAGSRCRGAQLVGARRRVGEVVEFWRPLPVPGSVAIFSSAPRASSDSLATSTVERVVVREKVRRLPSYGPASREVEI
jgi:hypothetical protein